MLTYVEKAVIAEVATYFCMGSYDKLKKLLVESPVDDGLKAIVCVVILKGYKTDVPVGVKAKYEGRCMEFISKMCEIPLIHPTCFIFDKYKEVVEIFSKVHSRMALNDECKRLITESSNLH